jgi:hypothetical protein
MMGCGFLMDAPGEITRKEYQNSKAKAYHGNKETADKRRSRLGG